jgi:Chaperone of endosialidase
MKTKILLSLVLVLSLCVLSAQVPQGFNYQAIARDSKGNPIPGALMQVKIGILSDTIANTMVWEELFNPVQTNAFGLFTIVIGTGVYQSGSATTFSAIDWTKTPFFLRTSIYYPNVWEVMGTTKLQSVPYAMVAANLEGTVPLLSVKGVTTTMDSALFVVRNNTGQIVFAVYNEGVRIYVDDGVKGTKGGFAIGGFGTSKSTSQEYFRVTRDSTRVYVNSATMPVTNGFGISSFGTLQKNILAVSNDLLPGSDNNSFLGTATNRWKTIYAVNGTIATSDARLKSNISAITYGLHSIMQLKPISFTWKDDPELRQRLGLVAQDVEKVISEVVDKGNDPAHTLGINYPEMIPILIKAIQEQQKEIEDLKALISTLAANQTGQGNK